MTRPSEKRRAGWAPPPSLGNEWMPGDKVCEVRQTIGVVGFDCGGVGFSLELDSAGLQELQHVAPAHMQHHHHDFVHHIR